jgi:hypothetical protein
MPKNTNLDLITTVRYGPGTAANLEIIQESGFAADSSAAFRVGVAALARGLVDDPRVWVVHQDGRNWRVFGTETAARAWLESQGAVPISDWWEVRDEDGDTEAVYEIEAVVPQ